MAPKEDAAAAMKRKADEDGDSPAAKEPKVEKEEKFVEPDAPEDKRAILKETISFDPRECTLNAIPTMGGRMLMMLSEGGMQYLLAGARANVGVKSGRYMYEVRMVEALTSSVAAGAGRAPTLVKHLVRIGFSLGGSSLVLAGGGEQEADGVCFDSDGFWACPGQKKKEMSGVKFGKDNVMAVVLNLDSESPNANTVTLFRDGVAASSPMLLPEILHGKVLFPHVTFRNASLQVHFGPVPVESLPFKCRTLQAAACEDVKVEIATKPQNGKFDVVFPVGMPDEGTFPWLEEFLKENPHHVELSDRKILEWAEKSGLWKPKSTGSKSSNDRPEFNFGIAALDNLSPRKIINLAAPLVPRHYVVMEVRGNLLPTIRKDTLKLFKSTHYKRIAKVVVGDPDKKYREKVHGVALKQKQEKLQGEFKLIKAEREKKRQIGLRQKQKKVVEEENLDKLIAARKKAEEDLQKKAEIKEAEEEKAAEAKKVKEAEEAAAKAEEDKDKPEKTEEEKKAEDEKMEEEKKAEEIKAKRLKERKEAEQKAREKKQETDNKRDEEKLKRREEEAKKDEQEKKDEDMEDAEECPVAELTEEEKSAFFPKREMSDLTSAVLTSSFGQFAMPDKDEGFNEVDYVWFGQPKAEEYFKSWVAEKKLKMKVEDLVPSDWFKTRFVDWQKAVSEWQSQQKEFKSDVAKMAAVKARDAKEAEKLGQGDVAKDGGDAPKKEGEDAEKKEEKKEGEAAESKEGEDAEKKSEDAPKEPEEQVTPSAAIDIWAVTDLSDIGNGEPLFLNFSFEDWALLSLRFEMNLMVRAFLNDTGDADRIGIHADLLAFYYGKYYNKQLNTKLYGADSVPTLMTMVKDVVGPDDKIPVLKSVLEQAGEGENVDIFVKLTEEKRRERQRRIDKGDETARLKFTVMASSGQAKSSPQTPAWSPGSRGQVVSPRPNVGGQAWSQPWGGGDSKDRGRDVGPKGDWKGGGKGGGKDRGGKDRGGGGKDRGKSSSKGGSQDGKWR